LVKRNCNTEIAADPCDHAVIELASEVADLYESLTKIDEIRK